MSNALKLELAIKIQNGLKKTFIDAIGFEVMQVMIDPADEISAKRLGLYIASNGLFNIILKDSIKSLLNNHNIDHSIEINGQLVNIETDVLNFFASVITDVVGTIPLYVLGNKFILGSEEQFFNVLLKITFAAMFRQIYNLISDVFATIRKAIDITEEATGEAEQAVEDFIKNAVKDLTNAPKKVIDETKKAIEEKKTPIKQVNEFEAIWQFLTKK